MKKVVRKIFLIFLFALPMFWNGCYGPAQVRVGVGVAVPGPWIGGPYPGGGGVWVGRPYPGPYYPALDNTHHFVQQTNPEAISDSDAILSLTLPESKMESNH